MHLSVRDSLKKVWVLPARREKRELTYAVSYRSSRRTTSTSSVSAVTSELRAAALSADESLPLIADLHWWDWSASIEEVMDSLHILVASGKVLYLGVSDTPAWIVAACNTCVHRRVLNTTLTLTFQVCQGARKIPVCHLPGTLELHASRLWFATLALREAPRLVCSPRL